MHGASEDFLQARRQTSGTKAARQFIKTGQRVGKETAGDTETSASKFADPGGNSDQHKAENSGARRAKRRKKEEKSHSREGTRGKEGTLGPL